MRGGRRGSARLVGSFTTDFPTLPSAALSSITAVLAVAVALEAV